jgi:hypothetical protein
MKKGFYFVWSICILVVLIVSCSSQASPTSLHATVATPNCDKGFSHLSLGQTITVVGLDHSNRVRSTPHVVTDNIISLISTGQYGTIVDGPVCADGLVFWKIESKFIPGGTGWSAEGNGTTHWLAPYKP